MQHHDIADAHITFEGKPAPVLKLNRARAAEPSERVLLAQAPPPTAGETRDSRGVATFDIRTTLKIAQDRIWTTESLICAVNRKMAR